MLYKFAHKVWNITKRVTGLLIAFLIAYFANLAVLQEKDISPTWFVGLVNWLFLPGNNRIITLSILIPLFIITLLSGTLVAAQKRGASSRPIDAKQSRQRILEKVRAVWITGVLEHSLHDATIIALGLQEQPDAVANSWLPVFQQPDRFPRPLAPGTRIIDVYDRGGGELLILGEPGSGKTTLLLELTRELLKRANDDINQPMPVVFNLSSWAVKRRAISSWLIEELNTRYHIPLVLAQSWVNADQILPLLDGLDEVSPNHLNECVKAINTYRRDHGSTPIVVCSRIDDYLNLKALLVLHSAVTVQPLTMQQIDAYISSTDRELAALRVALRTDPLLHELATLPLMLSILAVSFQGKSVEGLQENNSAEPQRQAVFATYVQYMLKRRGIRTRYTHQQTTHWLAWLARQITRYNQKEFHIDSLKSDWLPEGWVRRLYHFVGALILGLMGGLIGGLVFGLPSALAGGIIGGLVAEVGTEEFLASFDERLHRHLSSIHGVKDKALKMIALSWKSIRKYLIEALSGGLIGGFLSWLIFVIVVGLFGDIRFVPASAVHTPADLRNPLIGLWLVEVFWIVGFALLLGLPKFLSRRMGVTRIWLTGTSRWYFPRITYGFSTNGMLVSSRTWVSTKDGLLPWLLNLLRLVGAGNNWFMVGIFMGAVIYYLPLLLGGWLGIVLSIGLGIWLAGGILVCQAESIHEVVLWLLLWFTGCTPWNYSRFLDYATERILVYKIDYEYIFIHQLFLNYFASLESISTPFNEISHLS